MSNDPKKELDKARELAKDDAKKLKAIQIAEDIINMSIEIAKEPESAIEKILAFRDSQMEKLQNQCGVPSFPSGEYINLSKIPKNMPTYKGKILNEGEEIIHNRLKK